MKNTQNKLFKIRINKGDTVIVRAGKYKGTTGKVLNTHPKLNMVTVEGVNVVKKHVKPNRTSPQGTIVELTKPINVSKVGYYDATNKKASRISYKQVDGIKTRVAVTTGKEIK
jgi:large subunit ribosomal protein L24